jgi:3-oxoacyl-[acyl-carrier-protein] synthase-3
MSINYIFSGYGHAVGDYAVTNNDLYRAAQNGQLKGFNEDLILQSKNYLEYKKSNPNVSPFDYFVGHKMGFYKRHHVAPWPPTKENHAEAPTTLDLLVSAVDMAIKDAQIDPEQIDGWIVSTVSYHEHAPGIAATLKCYFVGAENQSPVMSLTSGCAGFNTGVKRAIEHFKANPRINHILLAHTEAMSHFLINNNDFVSHSTFGDAAAAIIVSRSKDFNSEGIIVEKTYHDILMVDSVGVDKDFNLYMDSAWVKNRAIANICKISNEALQETGWSNDDIDLIVPHQTGNAILHGAIQELGLPVEKLYQEAQRDYGNVSGTTIPLSLSLLKHQGRLTPGMNIICPTAGVGGEYGAFTYVVPKERPKPKLNVKPLKDKTVLLLFADSALGVSVSELLLEMGANVLAHVNQENDWSSSLLQVSQTDSNIKVVVETLNSTERVDSFIQQFENHKFDYCINLFSEKESIYGILKDFDALQWSAVNEHVSRKMLRLITKTIIVLAHPVEFVNHKSANPLKLIFSGWHGLMGSMSGEAASKGIRVIWYTPGIYEKMTAYMDSGLKNACKDLAGQNHEAPLEAIAERLVKSLYLIKVAQTSDTYQGPLVQRKELFKFRKNSVEQ